MKLRNAIASFSLPRIPPLAFPVTEIAAFSFRTQFARKLAQEAINGKQDTLRR
jgi:hypothetical protein